MSGAEQVGAVVGVRRLLVVLCVVVLVVGLLSGCFAAGSGCGQGGASVDAKAAGSKFGQWKAHQVGYAATIVKQGQQDEVPAYGWRIAVATAMQESMLKMYANAKVPESKQYPHDAVGRDGHSVGLFQQQPTQGWGSVKELMDPATSAHKFYSALSKVKGWESMSLTAAAQAVQRSAFPDAYAKWEDDSAKLIEHVTGSDIAAVEACVGSGKVSDSGWAAPVEAGIVSGFRTSERPDHDGVDLGAKRGASIRAAAAGTVVTVECNAFTNGSPSSCDVDGSPSVQGCGWYVDIEHSGGVITRYCHMVEAPAVSVGDRVAVGQVIGKVGTSGNSSGPHLHFEVHVDGRPTEPVAWMRSRGVKLG